MLDGGAGNDTLEGGNGVDQLDGPGGAGRRRRPADAAAETCNCCSAKDSPDADSDDKLASDCESPELAEVAKAMAITAKKLRMNRRGVAVLPMRCELLDGICEGTVTLTVKRPKQKNKGRAQASSRSRPRKRAVIGRASFKVEAGDSVKVKVKVSYNGMSPGPPEPQAALPGHDQDRGRGRHQEQGSEGADPSRPKLKGDGQVTASVPQAARVAIRSWQGLALAGLAAYAAQATVAVCGAGATGFFETYVYTGLIFVGASLCLTRAAASRTSGRPGPSSGLALPCWGTGEIDHTVALRSDGQPAAAEPL